MSDREQTGWAVVIVALFILWWLINNGKDFLHGTQTAVVQSGIVGGPMNEPTTTTYPAACCGGS